MKKPRCFPKYKNDRICDLCAYSDECKSIANEELNQRIDAHKECDCKKYLKLKVEEM